MSNHIRVLLSRMLDRVTSTLVIYILAMAGLLGAAGLTGWWLLIGGLMSIAMFFRTGMLITDTQKEVERLIQQAEEGEMT